MEKKKRRARRTKRPPERLLTELWELGLSDSDIAGLLGATSGAVGNWRRMLDLEANPYTKRLLDPATGRIVQKSELLDRAQAVMERWERKKERRA